MRDIILVAHNLRSCHNVGSLLRTADGLGVKKVYLTGYTPYPSMRHDIRLPHLANKLNAQIHKTALGAEMSVDWIYVNEIFDALTTLRKLGYRIAALEQVPEAIALPTFHYTEPLALLVGREVEGIEAEVMAACDIQLEIPMFGKKESFNVATAAAMALYQLSFA